MTDTYSTGRAFAGWWRESLQRLGLWQTLRSLATSIFELLRDLTPSRRRLRYGDMDYDWDFRVNTSWAHPALKTRIREIFTGRGYMPTEPELFREVIGGLGIDYGQFSFLDMGSGKGRALLLASEYDFRRILGVELLPELHEIAQENVRRFQDGTQTHRFELWCGDARQYSFPPDPLVLFLFDPFPEHILEQVIGNLEQSIRRTPRKLLIVYQNPISEHVLSNSTWLRRLRGDIRAAVYESTLA